MNVLRLFVLCFVRGLDSGSCSSLLCINVNMLLGLRICCWTASERVRKQIYTKGHIEVGV